MSPTPGNVLITNIHQIVQIVQNETAFLTGKDMNSISVLESKNNDLSIFCANGLITYVGKKADLPSDIIELQDLIKVDACGGSVIPGLVDGHSHPVFAGDRVHEFSMKLAGATYMEVQAAGGGIHFTTTKTREASKEQLVTDFKQIATEMIKNGTTTLEAKSGYGLEWNSELKMLETIEEVADLHAIEISATFCGAHAIPKGATEERQTKDIVEHMIPELLKLKNSGKLKSLENIDVFCEKNVFELNSSKQILEAGKAAGFAINFHADELHPLGGAELGASLGAHAMSHLEEISEAGIKEMAQSGTVATLLPSTAYMLRLKPPPARAMIDAGVIVALGSDFNPNAYCLAMPTIMHLACVNFRMSMPEALVASTLNAAHSLGRGKTHGAITVGRVADFVVLTAANWEHLIYRFAAHNTVINAVIKAGNVIYQHS